MECCNKTLQRFDISITFWSGIFVPLSFLFLFLFLFLRKGNRLFTYFWIKVASLANIRRSVCVVKRFRSRFKIWNKGSCLLYLIFYKKGWIINVSRQGFTLLQIWIYRNNFKNESRLILNLFHHLGVNLIFFVFLAKKFKWKRRELILLYFFLNERDDSRIGRKKRLKTTNWRRLKSLVTKLSVELKRAYAWKFFFTLRPEFFQNRIANFRFISTIETIGGFILTNGCLHPAPRKFHGFDSASVGKKPKVLNLTIQLFEVRPPLPSTTFYIIPNTFS